MSDYKWLYENFTVTEITRALNIVYRTRIPCNKKAKFNWPRSGGLLVVEWLEQFSEPMQPIPVKEQS